MADGFAAAKCPRENCPCEAHDVHWVWADEDMTTIIGVSYVCQLCGADDTEMWYTDDTPEGDHHA